MYSFMQLNDITHDLVSPCLLSMHYDNHVLDYYRHKILIIKHLFWTCVVVPACSRISHA